jgi:hypothetical protein
MVIGLIFDRSKAQKESFFNLFTIRGFATGFDRQSQGLLHASL